jgi:hypothetical protein
VHLLLRRIGRHGAVVGVLMVLLQCGGSDLTLPEETAAADIRKLEDGDNQSGPAGSLLPKPLQVEVTNRRGVPVANQPVAFSIDPPLTDASVSPSVDTTDEAGIAEAQWTLGGPAGIQEVKVTVVGAEDLETTFHAEALPGEADRIEAFSGSDQTAPIGTALSNPLVARVTDQYGNPVSGADVDWEVESGSVDPNSSSTGPDGLATTTWVLGSSVGVQTATASNEGLNGSPVSFTAIALPGDPDALVLVSGNNQTAGPGEELDEPLVVRLVDQQGNGVPGRPVSWVIGVGGGTVTETTSITDGNGEAQVRWTLGPSPGLNTVNAVVSGVDFVTFRAFALGGSSGGGDGSSASRLGFLVQPSSAVRQETISPPVQVEVLDQSGSRVTTGEYQINLELIGNNDGKLKGHTNQRTSAGVATFDDIEVDEEGEYRLRAATNGLSPAESASFEVREEDDDDD